MGKMFNKKAALLIATVFSASLALSNGNVANAEVKQITKEELKLVAIKEKAKQIESTDKFSGIETAKKDTENVEVKTEGDPNEEIRVIVELEGAPAATFSRNSADQIIASQENIQEKVEEITENDVENNFGSLVNGFSIDAKRGELEEIASLPGVSKVSEANVYYPSMATAVDLTQVVETWQDYGYNGEGLVVAIIDTGIDYTHKDLRNPENYDAMKIKATDIVDGPGKYYSDKVPYGYNFADKNDEIIDTTGSEHGMHVAGIVAADATDEDYNNGTGIRGVAPEAQLLAMKVFTNNSGVSGAYSDDIIAAIEDSVIHGADIINMSLGSSAGYVDSDDPEQIAIKNATDAGTLCVVSAGNSYYSTYPYWFGAMNDVGTVGSPGLAEDALQVASYENSSVKLQAFSLDVNGTSTLIGHTTADIKPSDVFEPGEELEVVDCGYGTPEDFAGKDLAGKVALIQRGNIAFTEKALNAQAAGAEMAVIYNNEAGGDEYINMATDPAINIPYIFITNTDGNKVLNSISEGGKISFNSYTVTVGNVSESEMSAFSSWGAAPNLGFAPQVSSIGGNIYSTVNNNSYTTMSGTSMSSPNVAGSSALILQGLKEAGIELEGRELVEFVKNTIINTAKVEYDTEYYNDGEMPYSPRRQGAGLIQVEDALENRVLALTDEGKATIALKEIGNSTSFNITLKNYGDKTETYNIDTINGVLTTYNPGFGVASEMVFDTILEGADVTFDNNTVTVPAGGQATVTAVLTIPADAAKDIFAEGFITFTPEDENTSSLVMPFMGYYGNWSDELIINDPAWNFEAANILPVSAAAAGILGDYNYLGYEGRDDYGDIIINENEIAISPNGDELADALIPYLFMLRNAKDISVDILDQNMNVVAENVANETKVRKQIFNTTSNAVLRKALSWDGTLYNKSTGNYEVTEGQYYMNIKAKVDLASAEAQSFIIPVKVDITEPTIEVLSDNTAEGTSYQLKLKVSDNLAGVNGSELLVYVNGEKSTGNVSVEGDVITVDTELVNGTVNTITYGVLDNAYNLAVGEIQVQAGEVPYEKPAVTFNYGDAAEFTNSEVVLEGNVTGSYGKLQICGEDVAINADGTFAVNLTLEEGRNNIAVYLEDVNGNQIESYSLKFYCDTIAPVIELSTPVTADNVIITPFNKVVLKGNVSDNTMGYTFSINGEVLLNEMNDGAYGNDTNRKEFQKEIDVEDGDVILLEATDVFGNKTAEKYTVKVDENACVLNVEGVNNNGIYNTDVTPTFTVNDEYKIVSTTLNGAAYDGKAITEEGQYELVVEVAVNSENESEETIKYVIKFTIDKSAPAIQVSGVENEGIYNTDVTPVVSTEEDAEIKLLLNGESYDGTAITEEGSYQLSISAKDCAGNIAESVVNFEIDKTAPEVNVNGVINGMKYDKDVTPEVVVDDETATVVMTLNGESYNGDAITAEGTYALVVTATDKAGNVSEVTINFSIDKTDHSNNPSDDTPQPGDNGGSGTIDTPVTDDNNNGDNNGNSGNNGSNGNVTTVKPSIGKGNEATSMPVTGNDMVIYITIGAVVLIVAGTLILRKKKRA